MAIIAVTGRKGGIGKSTITANLAAELTALGHRVAVLDTDPQQSLVAWATLGSGLLTTCVTAVETAHPERFQAAVHAATQRATRVLIDTPPGFPDPALLAALLADLVLLPAGPSPLDILAARAALALTHDARAQRGGASPMVRFVPSKIQAHTTLSRDLATSLAGLGAPVLPPLGLRVAVAEAALHGLTIREYAPHSAAHAEYLALAHAVEELVES